MKWQNSAPSNIALIKYMGKVDSNANRPSNASLSWTLENLRTFIEIEESTGPADSWEPLQKDNCKVPELSKKGKARFLQHFNFLKKEFGVSGSFTVRSVNNFPSDCGLASSASSFAALTLTACEAFSEISGKKVSLSEISKYARVGSGSSCRSVFSPWAIWEGEGAAPVELPYQELLHQAVVVEDHKKIVSSSEAHLRVPSSALFRGRPERAQERLASLLQSLKNQEWRNSFELCWAEFWDMHGLFETAAPPFSYMTPESVFVVRKAQQFWHDAGTGPLITMDAGANVHMLWLPEHMSEARKFVKELPQFRVYSSFGDLK
ncbi:MAG: diphosphomevalonate/mevalonate 3,5-bisphosphate decarboxylase family protein [Pseudobdellovibrionaceae bacterium]